MVGDGERGELGAKAQIEKNFPRPAKHHRHQSEDIVWGVTMAAVTVHGFVCCCVFALPESPSDGEITGLSNQQMQTAENNLIRSPQRGILRGPSVRDAEITSNKESRYFCSNQGNSTITHSVQCVSIHDLKVMQNAAKYLTYLLSHFALKLLSFSTFH